MRLNMALSLTTRRRKMGKGAGGQWRYKSGDRLHATIVRASYPRAINVKHVWNHEYNDIDTKPTHPSMLIQPIRHPLNQIRLLPRHRLRLALQKLLQRSH